MVFVEMCAPLNLRPAVPGAVVLGHRRCFLATFVVN
jgi:hypothetical protein